MTSRDGTGQQEGTEQQGGHLGVWFQHLDFSMENNYKMPSEQGGPKAFSSQQSCPFPHCYKGFCPLRIPWVLTENDRPARLLVLMISVMVTLRQPRSVTQAEGWSGATAQPQLSPTFSVLTMDTQDSSRLHGQRNCVGSCLGWKAQRLCFERGRLELREDT